MPDASPLIDGPDDAPLTLIFAHGAGAPMDGPFMESVAAGLAAKGWRIRRFEFPYMAQRRLDGTRRPPDPAPRLLEAFRTQIRAEQGRDLILAGKSMGGRMASLLADETEVKGWLCFGYPFHPPGRPERTRTDPLRDLGTAGLILQGTRDLLGSREEVAAYHLSEAITLHWIEDGDHHLAPRRASGLSPAEALSEALEVADRFLRGLARS